MSLKASARRVGDGLVQEVDVNGRHMLATDEPPKLGGSDHGPAPHELLPAAVAACIGTMITMYARTKRWDVRGYTVDVDYDQEAVPRHFDIEIRLPSYLSAEQVERLTRVADTCPVRRALEVGFEVEERIVVQAASPRSHAA